MEYYAAMKKNGAPQTQGEPEEPDVEEFTPRIPCM